MTSSLDSLRSRVASFQEKTAASSILWKYSLEGIDLYLTKKLTTVRSPLSGKSVTMKPERVSLSEVGKELKAESKGDKAKKEASTFSWKSSEPAPVAKVAAEGKALPGSLWEYKDEDGNSFYLAKKQTGALKSPFTGKTFTSKPVKNTLSDVGQDLKNEGKKKKASEDEEEQKEQSKTGMTLAEVRDLKEKVKADMAQPPPVVVSSDPWKVDPSFAVLAEEPEEPKKEEKSEGQQKQAAVKHACGGACSCNKGAEQTPEEGAAKTAEVNDPWKEAGEFLDQGDKHPAMKVISEAFEKVLKAIEETKKRNENLRRFGAGNTEAGTLIIANVIPEIEELAETALIVARQMEKKFK